MVAFQKALGLSMWRKETQCSLPSIWHKPTIDKPFTNNPFYPKKALYKNIARIYKYLRMYVFDYKNAGITECQLRDENNNTYWWSKMIVLCDHMFCYKNTYP